MGAIASRSSSEVGNGVAIHEPTGGRRGRRGRRGHEGVNGGRNEASPVADVIKRLTQIQPGKHRVVTCYLKLEPRDRSRGKYLIKIKNRVKSAHQALPRLGLERSVADAVARDLDRVQQYLRAPGNLPSTQ